MTLSIDLLMKINEILDQNRQWAILIDIKLSFEQEYTELVNIIEVIVRVKHRSKYPALIDAINRFRSNATEMFNAKLPISNDPDLVSLKENVNKMLNHLKQLESQLK